MIGENCDALLFHLGEELRRVAFAVEDDRKAAQERIGFQLLFGGLVWHLGLEPWGNVLAQHTQ